MSEISKERLFDQEIIRALEKATLNDDPVLFSYSFRFEIRDLLPLLTHPSDKDTIRVYWEQPSKGFV